MTDGFGIDHLPYGIFSVYGGPKTVGVRLGDTVIDLYAATGREEFHADSLNPFMSLGRSAWESTRAELVSLVEQGHPPTRPLGEVDLHLPIEVGDYVDFYASADHASNVGRIFRPEQAPLLPNWKHLPVGYHGRSGTVVASGTDIVRPHGQRKLPSDESPVFGPSTRLDIETELGFVVGTGTALGDRVSTGAFADHTFGVLGRQRLVRARHPGLGVRAARPVPRQVVRHHDLPLGHPARRARRCLGRPPRAGPRSSGVPRRRRSGRPGHRHRGRPQRPRRQPAAVLRRCTGARPRCWRT